MKTISRNSFLSFSFFILVAFCLVFLPVPAGGQTAWKEIQVGQNYLRSGEYVNALEEMNAAIGRTPFVPELYFLRGYAKYSLDDYIGAELDYSKAIELSPYRPEFFINRAEVRSQQSNLNGALEDLGYARRLDSVNPEVYLGLARIKLMMKFYYGCIGDCNKVILKDPKNDLAYLIRGTAEIELNRFDSALSDFKTAIGLNPGNPNAYIRLGAAWLEKEEADSAIRYFNLAIGADSNNVYALFSRSLALVKRQDLPGAKADLDKIIRLSPFNSYAYFNRAILLFELEDPAGAIRDFDYVIRLNPMNITSYYYRGLLRSEMKDYRGALEDLDRTVELLPTYAAAYYERYRVKLMLRDRAGAMKDFELAEKYGQENHFTPDSLTPEKKSYLQGLVDLSGDFEEMNSFSVKFQNQPVDIRLQPVFFLFTGQADLRFLYLYDAYEKKHYHAHILPFTNREELIRESDCLKEIEAQSRRIDSVFHPAESYLLRGLAFASLKRYREAVNDFDSSLARDPGSVIVWFSRANSRFGMIQARDSNGLPAPPVTIGNEEPGAKAQHSSPEDSVLLKNVLGDYSQALELDPDFPFAYFNRGVVYCQLSKYREAVNEFTAAIRLKSDLAEAYYNRGLIRILLNELLPACEDLSRAGELGISDSYKVIKRYCFK